MARALLLSLRQLKRSVDRRQTMSLPNLIRLFRRAWADSTLPAQWSSPAAARAASLLDLFYHCQQPFAGTDWRRGRRWVRAASVASCDALC